MLYVDRRCALRQLDALCILIPSGAAGIKFASMWEGRKSDADVLYSLIRACADHHLICDIHDNIRPARAGTDSAKLCSPRRRTRQ